MATLVRSHQVALKRVCGGQANGCLQIPVPTKNKSDTVPVVLSNRNSRLSISVSSYMLSAISVKPIVVASHHSIHTDISFPKYGKSERSKAANDSTKSARDTEDYRRATAQGLLFGVNGAVYLYMATKFVQSLVTYKSMPADQLAMANTEIDLNEIPEGQCKTYTWRGKPLFVAHRTQDDIGRAKNVNLSELRDPQTDDERVKKDEWLVTIGVCPHLGCVPIAGKGDFGGYYCPCHGSTFDTSGRIRLGPAPNNLEVPPYQITDNNKLILKLVSAIEEIKGWVEMLLQFSGMISLEEFISYNVQTGNRVLYSGMRCYLIRSDRYFYGCVMSEKKTAGENGTSANNLHDMCNVVLSSKPTKLAKQSGIDEEEIEECSNKFKGNNEEVKESSTVRVQQISDSNTHETVLMPPHHISLNVTVSTKSKVLVRSHAFSGDDDSGVSTRHTPTSRFLASRSTFSSASFDSGHSHDYTDSTGINLLSFITCTLHKNSKDRHMLLQLEQHMIKLIKDSTRNSQKFPAMSSYNRMLVHRVAAFFGLDHNVDQNGTAVVVNKTSHTRLPDIDFMSLIQSDMYTDEPRRLLRRDVQSYEEIGQSLDAGVIFGRRARSFEMSDCLSGDPTTVTIGCALPATASLHMHLLHQQGSTSSTDASSTHLLESPGSCYSYNDKPVMGVYSASESSPSFSSATHMFPWSSSESYTSLSTDYPSSLISPIVHNHPRTPMLMREVNTDTNAPLYKNFNTHSSFSEQRMPVSKPTNPDWHRQETIYSKEASIPENLLPENIHFTDEYGVEIATSQQQTQPLYAHPSLSADFISNQYIINPVQEQTTYAVVAPYVRYGTPTLSVQKLTQQMESLCTAGYPEVVPLPPQPYLVSPAAAHTMYPQQISTIYSPQPYFLPVMQRNYVPNITNVQGTYPVSFAQYPISSYECGNMQQGSLMDAIRIAKNGPMFEGSTTVTENENVSN
ncbi:Cytochrome b-c1 complex subunit Rieske [Dirofilaria immitis]